MWLCGCAMLLNAPRWAASSGRPSERRVRVCVRVRARARACVRVLCAPEDSTRSQWLPRRVRAVLASRACRTSIMIGTPLDQRRMRKVGWGGGHAGAHGPVRACMRGRYRSATVRACNF